MWKITEETHVGECIMPKNCEFFLDPIDIIKHYKRCPLNKNNSSILGYGLVTVWCFFMVIQQTKFKNHHITHCNHNTPLLRKYPSNLYRQNQYSNLLLLLQHHQAYDYIDSGNCQQHILHSTDNNTPSSARWIPTSSADRHWDHEIFFISVITPKILASTTWACGTNTANFYFCKTVSYT